MFDRADFRVLCPHFPHHAQGIVPAAVKNDDQLKFSLVILAKKLGVFQQNGANPALLIVCRYQQ